MTHLQRAIEESVATLHSLKALESRWRARPSWF